MSGMGTRILLWLNRVEAANAILHFAPETNGEVAFRGFQAKERDGGSRAVRFGRSQPEHSL